MQSNRVTDLIRLDHIWFRSQFAALNDARGDTATVTSLWGVLSARLEVHAAAEETLFYPRLLKDDSDAVDDTKDAIKDHNEIRDGIRDAEAHTVGDDAWWAAVKATDHANPSIWKKRKRVRSSNSTMPRPLESRRNSPPRSLRSKPSMRAHAASASRTRIRRSTWKRTRLRRALDPARQVRSHLS
jgi:hypothetical protein